VNHEDQQALDACHVDVVGIPIRDQAAYRVGQDAEVGVVHLPQQAPAIEPVDHGQALGMLRDLEVFETLLHGCPSHLLQRAATIGGDRVAVQIAAQVERSTRFGSRL
jgi:hypothetical protein